MGVIVNKGKSCLQTKRTGKDIDHAKNNGKDTLMDTGISPGAATLRTGVGGPGGRPAECGCGNLQRDHIGKGGVLEHDIQRPPAGELHRLHPQSNRDAPGVLRVQNRQQGNPSAAAQALERGGDQVVAGINGDYYVVNTGVPLGLVVTDGILRSSSSYVYGIGFQPDGTAFIGQPNLKITANTASASFDLSGFNKVRKSEGGIYLFSSDFGSNTMNTSAGVDVILSLPEGDLVPNLKIGGSVTATVDKVVEATGSTALTAGKIVLSVNASGSTYDLSLLRALKAGDSVTIRVSSADTRWNSAQFATGGLYRLLVDGKVNQDLEAGSSPRTAVGVRNDGSMVFYTIDGRQPGYSIGATMAQVANRLLELGCTNALCLDGGGSTSLGVTLPDEDSFGMINNPSDGGVRANSTSIVLVSSAGPTGVLGHFYVEPYDALLLAGASLSMKATALDTNYRSLAYSGSLTYDVASGGGSVSSGGVFTAGSAAGVSTVRVSAGTATGSADITVVKKPGAIQINNSSGSKLTSLAVSPGASVDLKAAATYYGLPLVAQNSCFTWAASSGAGTVDANGRFTAASQSGSGTLTVSAGGRSTSIPVTVSGRILTLEGFEGALGSFAGGSTAALALETDPAYVKFGWQSLKAAYAMQSGAASFDASLPISPGDTHLSLWVYGDSSGNTLSVRGKNSAGQESAIPLCTLNFTGWQRAAALLPAGTASLSGFRLTQAEGGAPSGTLWLDQITIANEAVEDDKAPSISASLSGRSFSAALSDAYDKTLSKDNIDLTYDGAAVSFTFTASTGKLTATLPASDGKLHRVTLVARDKSGNLARYSKNIETVLETDPAFVDMGSHWAREYAQYLKDRGVASGIATPAGLTFQPDKTMSRAEFAAMLARHLGVVPQEYADTALPFADAAQIPGWALNEVKAMYALGMLKGSSNGGVLAFSPSGGITRGEVMTILGRTLEQGFPKATLTYRDAASVPAWALPSVQTLTALKIVSGYDNLISPGASITRCEVAKLLVSLL